MVEELSPEAVKERIEAGDTQVVDIRPPSAFERGPVCQRLHSKMPPVSEQFFRPCDMASFRPDFAVYVKSSKIAFRSPRS